MLQKSTACEEGVALCSLLRLPRAGVETAKFPPPPPLQNTKGSLGIHAQTLYGLRVDVQGGILHRPVCWWYPPGVEILNFAQTLWGSNGERTSGTLTDQTKRDSIAGRPNSAATRRCAAWHYH
ncbi:unnamed protein product, partial [Iphiclides podalirius]